MKELPPEPPFDLEVAKEWLLDLSDKVDDARRDAFAARFLLGNLLFKLHEDGTVNALPFIIGLHDACKMLPAYEAGVAKSYLDDLLSQLSAGGKPDVH